MLIKASSQANESFNNIVATKAPKNKCLSRSAACDYRVADSVCTKNNRESSVLNVQRILGLQQGTHMVQYATAANKKRQKRVTKSNLKSVKQHRIKLKQKRDALRKKNEIQERVIYKSNCGINITMEFEGRINQHTQISNLNVMYFDLETTDLAADARTYFANWCTMQ